MSLFQVFSHDAKELLLEREFAEDAPILLDHLELRNACFREKILTKASFYQSYLPNADFRGAALRHANFGKAYLKRANFYGADLRGADFTFATLYESNLIQGGRDPRGYDFWACANENNVITIYAACKTFTGLRAALEYPYAATDPHESSIRADCLARVRMLGEIAREKGWELEENKRLEISEFRDILRIAPYDSLQKFFREDESMRKTGKLDPNSDISSYCKSIYGTSNYSNAMKLMVFIYREIIYRHLESERIGR